MPNFLIIGAPKSGTTSLYFYLKQHPQIYMSPDKDPHFFALEGGIPKLHGHPDAEILKWWRTRTTSIEAYQRLFQGVKSEKAIGEASANYLVMPESPRRIHHYLPDVKLIAILRNPVDRAYSHFCHSVRGGAEELTDFAQALQEEERRMGENWGWGWYYKQMGFYYTQLKRYYDTFNPKQIKVYLYEDLCNDPVGLTQDIFRFLGVDDTFVPEVSSKYNVNIGIPRKNKLLYPLLKIWGFLGRYLKFFIPDALYQPILSTHKKLAYVKPQLLQDIRRQLIELYQEDILRLQNLIQRDLSKWLE